jgi:hypothetical protein
MTPLETLINSTLALENGEFCNFFIQKIGYCAVTAAYFYCNTKKAIYFHIFHIQVQGYNAFHFECRFVLWLDFVYALPAVDFKVVLV